MRVAQAPHAVGQRHRHAGVALARHRGVALRAQHARCSANTPSANSVSIQASDAARPWSYCAPTMAKKISVDSTENWPPTTIGLPKSAMLSMKPTRKALARPGFSSGSVTVRKVRRAAGAQRLRRLLQAGRDALHHAAHDHEGDRREGEGLRQPHAEPAVEPARRRDAEGPLQQLVDDAGAAEQQDQAQADDERRRDDRQQRQHLQRPRRSACRRARPSAPSACPAAWCWPP